MEQNHIDVRSIIRDALEEFVSTERAKAEPVYKTELTEERKRREVLEQRINELVAENNRSRMRAEEMERAGAIRSELQKLGVAKVDLAFKAVKDEIVRTDDGRLVARTDAGEASIREYLTHFVNENPELLPARMAGGSGASSFAKHPAPAALTLDVDKIRPGMSEDELDKIRQEISRVASQTMRGL